MKFQTTILIVIVIASCFTLTAWTQQSSIEQQAWTYILQARQGDSTAGEKAVALLEQATAAAPNDAALWNLLGRSYFFRLSTQSRKVASLDEAVPAVKSAIDAFDHVLKINPDDPTGLSGHGMALTLLGAFQQKQEALIKGVGEMNRAVDLDPKATHLRLTRGFTMVNFPPQVRNTPKVIEDLSVLVRVAEVSNQRAADSLHIMLGDVYFETGQMDLARSQYEAAAAASSATKDKAQSRLDALRAGTAPMAEIVSFRSSIGTNCTMCHGQ